MRQLRTHNQEYYYHPATKELLWEPPEGTDAVQLRAYLQERAQKPDKVRASHLLVKHAGLRRPALWKEDPITRTREEAIDILRGWEQKIANGEVTLGEVAKEHSDCALHAQSGDLGLFGKGQMQPPFERAAFKLAVGEVSGIVETDSGVHLIERTA